VIYIQSNDSSSKISMVLTRWQEQTVKISKTQATTCEVGKKTHDTNLGRNRFQTHHLHPYRKGRMPP
jgi:hypothetical protein